jgi:acyl-CoA thioester hydrolase
MEMKNKQKKYRWPIRVYYEDTDAGGVVYYANYLKFMERGRTEWLRGLGFEQDQLKRRDGILFAVYQVNLRYHLPALFNDALEVVSSLSKKGRVGLTFYQEVVRTADSRQLCDGEIVIACVDTKTMRATPIPEKILLEIPDVD